MANQTEENKSKVAVIGLGSVGGALKHTLEFFYKVVGYDINGNYEWKGILDSDILFICVQTNTGDDGRLDCSHVTEVLSRLSEDSYKGIVVIRSTLRIGYMEFATKTFQNLHLVYSPEFIRERSRLQWSVCPDRIVMSGSREDVDRALKYFGWAEEAEVLVMDYRSAEIGKLANNAYIATKVSFTNEMEMICRKLGGDAESVMDIVTTDRRVRTKEHHRPFLGPYEGKCVPKDTLELITAAENPILLSAVHKVNEVVKNNETKIAMESNVPKC
jgi:UDPglucose 6-dehydrogenase